MKTTRFDTGCYRTTDGRFEIQSMAYWSEGESTEKAWILFDRLDWSRGGDGYCGHYTTKAAALEGAEIMLAEEAAKAQGRAA